MTDLKRYEGALIKVHFNGPSWDVYGVVLEVDEGTIRLESACRVGDAARERKYLGNIDVNWDAVAYIVWADEAGELP